MKEKSIPITKRTDILKYEKYYPNLTRELVKIYLNNSHPGEFLLRSSTLGPDSLALSLVTSSPGHTKTVETTQNNNYIRHFVFKATDISQIESGQFGEYDNLIHFIEDFCANLAKPEYKDVSTIQEYETIVTVNQSKNKSLPHHSHKM